MLIVGEINPEHFKGIHPILTTYVVLTDKQIEHIKERHPCDYERYAKYIPQILNNPDYIFQDNKPDSAIILKEFKKDDERFRLILRIKTSNDADEYMNSIISFWRIGKRRFDSYLRNEKVLYKAE